MPPLPSDDAHRFLAERHWGVLVTMKASGRPQLSNVGYALLDDRVQVSVTETRAKTANARRDPRVSLHVTSSDFWTYVVAEGDAALSPTTRSPGDATGQALLRLYEATAGKPHPDPDEYFQAMVDQRRLVMSFAIAYLYPTA